MTRKRYELTRRKILASVGAVGVAGAGAGLGTSALFSDEESFTNNSITAGTLDMSVTAEVVEASEYYTSSGAGPNVVGEMETADGNAVVGLQASDVKPGDWIIICFEISVGDNPAYVRVSAEDFAQYENGQTEPEGDVDSSGGGSLGMPQNGQGAGELQDKLVAEVYDGYDGSDDSSPPRSHLGGKHPNLSGTAQSTFEQFATGVVIGGFADPTPVGSGSNSPTNLKRYLLLELPADVGNEVQSDAIEFDLVFDAVQVRNNDGFEPSSSLVGYWPLNSIEDGTAEDLSGNGNDGTPNGASAALGQVDGAAAFDGSGQHVEIPSISIDGSLSVAAWVKRESNSGWQAASTQGDNGNDTRNWWLGGRNGADRVHWSLYDQSNTNQHVDSSSGSLPQGTFTHIVGVYDQSAGELRIYVDGQPDGSQSVPSFTPQTSSDPGAIGAELSGGSPTDPFDGVVDDVRVYERALSAQEVLTIYNDTS
jgi:predicted ribosomally synthesized peptide with SipW-like signal peptide